MARTPGELDGGSVVWSTGVGDAIAQVLRQKLGGELRSRIGSCTIGL